MITRADGKVGGILDSLLKNPQTDQVSLKRDLAARVCMQNLWDPFCSPLPLPVGRKEVSTAIHLGNRERSCRASLRVRRITVQLISQSNGAATLWFHTTARFPEVY